MSVPALIVFPHQLFASNRRLARGKRIYLVEDALYFRQYAFHKHKLVLHRASMQEHRAWLEAGGLEVTYLESAEAPDMRTAVARIRRDAPSEAHYIDPVDDWLERRLQRELAAAGVRAVRHDTPMFLATPGFLEDQFRGRRRVHMASFYAAHRSSLGVLMKSGKPVGGRWSFDAANRKRLPRGLEPPAPSWPRGKASVGKACAYVDANFPDNPGQTSGFRYPVTRAAASAWLRDFVRHRLPRFGDYEDAIAADQPVLFHSVLSPLLNIGLLEPREVLDAALGASGVPLNSLEGFVRQIIGWREYVRAAYVYYGRRQRTRNLWAHGRALPAAFWTADTGIAPVDTVVRRVLRHAYAHHIERLMVLGNFMLLCEFRPDDVYRWFMELFIDAYDWVMVPNVYGMALHADGGLITTKPYVSGSNYLLKMSDFARGPWCETWDALFWRFVEQKRDFLSANPRLGMMVRQLERLPAARRDALRRHAAAFLEGLD